MYPHWGLGSGGGANDDLARSSLNRDPTGPTRPTRPLRGGRVERVRQPPTLGLLLGKLVTMWDRPPPRASEGRYSKQQSCPLFPPSLP